MAQRYNIHHSREACRSRKDSRIPIDDQPLEVISYNELLTGKHKFKVPTNHFMPKEEGDRTAFGTLDNLIGVNSRTVHPVNVLIYPNITGAENADEIDTQFLDTDPLVRFELENCGDYSAAHMSDDLAVSVTTVPSPGFNPITRGASGGSQVLYAKGGTGSFVVDSDHGGSINLEEIKDLPVTEGRIEITKREGAADCQVEISYLGFSIPLMDSIMRQGDEQFVYEGKREFFAVVSTFSEKGKEVITGRPVMFDLSQVLVVTEEEYSAGTSGPALHALSKRRFDFRQAGYSQIRY